MMNVLVLWTFFMHLLFLNVCKLKGKMKYLTLNSGWKSSIDCLERGEALRTVKVQGGCRKGVIPIRWQSIYIKRLNRAQEWRGNGWAYREPGSIRGGRGLPRSLLDVVPEIPWTRAGFDGWEVWIIKTILWDCLAH